MKIAVIGTGYVGLVTGACFSQMGNHVTCVDVDLNKLAKLEEGELPIYEPGLDTVVAEGKEMGLLNFTNDLAKAMIDAEVIFIAVGTPPGEDGSADLSYVLQAAKSIGERLSQYVVVVDKSTVPVGTADKVKTTIRQALAKRQADIPFDVVSNPEFLKEGAAVTDFMKPDRIVVGVDSEDAQGVMQELYAPFSRNHDKLHFMGVRDAEMTKYAANAMLATKISFMNEMANLCEKLDVDVENVRKGIGSDDRIGYSFIYPGCGYGGSCFPKDVKAIIQMSKEVAFEPWILDAVEQRNQSQKAILAEKVFKRFGNDLSGLSFMVWGLAFKPGTDDMREAPSINLIESLVKAGATINAYDPVAQKTARDSFPEAWFKSGQLTIGDELYKPLKGASGLILVTEWKMFRQPDFNAMKSLMKTPVIFDGRNQYQPNRVKAQGFDYIGIGR